MYNKANKAMDKFSIRQLHEINNVLFNASMKLDKSLQIDLNAKGQFVVYGEDKQPLVESLGVWNLLKKLQAKVGTKIKVNESF